MKNKIIFLLLGFIGVQGAEAQTCQSLYTQKNSSYLESAYGEEANPAWSVRIRGRIVEAGKLDRVRVDLNTQKTKWYHMTSDVEGSLTQVRRGNPLWSLSWVGEKAAKFFGMERVGNKSILLPTADFINRSIKKSNLATRDPNLKIDIRYYTPKNDRVIDEVYVKKFIYEGALPVASRGSEYLHDINFHLLSVLFMPPRVIKRMRETYQLQLDFRNYLFAKHPALAQTLEKTYPVETDVMGISFQIDSITSELLSKNSLFRQDQDASEASIFPSWSGMLGGDGLSPAEAFVGVWKDRMVLDESAFKRLTGDQRKEITQVASEYANKSASSKPELNRKLYLDEVLEQEINQRIESLRSLWENLLDE